MMTAEQLKNSILQLAMQGKLVEQRPEEGTGEELYWEIQAEKKRLVKEGLVKKQKPLPEITEDEIPFEIPETWKWVRVSDICTKLVDGDHNPPKGIIGPSEYVMASSKNINQDKLVELDQVRYLDKSTFLKENERTMATKGDIFFTSVGSLGRSCVYDGTLNICFQRSVSVMTTLVFNHFLKRCFDSGYFQNKVYREATGTAQKGFYLNQLAIALIPLPPLEEQKRIVSKIEELMPFAEQYAASSTKLNTLNASFPEMMKKSILQEAVQGKLVLQDPNDEPASVLLKKIAEEKKRLIKEGKIKKQKLLPEISEDEIPFEIPESWEWVRLESVCHDLRYGTSNKSSKTGEIVVIRMGNIQNGEIDYSDLVYSLNEQDNEKYKLEPLDILFNRTNSRELVGKTGIYRGEKPAIFAGYLVQIRPINIDPEYINYVMNSEYERNYCKDVKSDGINQSNVNATKIGMFVIPVPPLAEQHRIVERLNKLLPRIKELF